MPTATSQCQLERENRKEFLICNRVSRPQRYLSLLIKVIPVFQEPLPTQSVEIDWVRRKLWKCRKRWKYRVGEKVFSFPRKGHRKPFSRGMYSKRFDCLCSAWTNVSRTGPQPVHNRSCNYASWIWSKLLLNPGLLSIRGYEMFGRRYTRQICLAYYVHCKQPAALL